MIVYQFAMILCVISESVGTAALSDYVDQQDGITTRHGPTVVVENNDIVGILSYNIFIGIAVATIFGSGFFFDLFWPKRTESKSVRLAWKICSVVISFMALADVVALTVIVATRAAHINGVSAAAAQSYFNQNGPPNPIYRKNPDCVTSVILLWLGVVACFASTYIMWKSIRHDEKLGPWSSRVSSRNGAKVAEEESIGMDSRNSSATAKATNPDIAPAGGASLATPPSAPQPTYHTEPSPYPGT